MTKTVTILCGDPAHPVNAYLDRWIAERSGDHDIRLEQDVKNIGSGDILFMISHSHYVSRAARERFRHALVVHASDLPRGRGWSPHIWSVLNGENRLVVTLLEAADSIDSGAIFRKETVELDGSELYDEINHLLFEAELRLMDWALLNCDEVAPTPQEGEPSQWPRRTPADGRIDPQSSIAEVFDLLRTADPERYPAFFDHRGHRYRIRIEKTADASAG